MITVNGKNYKDYYVQSVPVNDQYKDSDRLGLLIPLITGKKVLHVGFVDWPVTDVRDSLHLTLSPHCERLDGIDVNIEHAEKLRVPNGNIYWNWNNVPDDYDVILVPEVIEHVDNIKDFLSLFGNKKGTLIVTAPDAYLLQNRFEYRDGQFVEVVHPDHNCYYTPFTLKVTLEKHTSKKVESMYWVQGQSVVAICK